MGNKIMTEDKIILEAKMTGLSDGKELDSPYRIVITKRNGKWLFSPEQAFKNDLTGKYEYNMCSGLPGWYLETLMAQDRELPDEIYIDLGQRWSIKGMQKAVYEAYIKTKDIK